MQLDYIPNINTYGDNLIRLYNFDKAQSIKFREAVQSFLKSKEPLVLSSLDFIEPRNCEVTFRLSDTDEGIVRLDKIQFFCDLTVAGFEGMLERLEPFCKKETKGYQYLYELDILTDFLFSPAGTW